MRGEGRDGVGGRLLTRRSLRSPEVSLLGALAAAILVFALINPGFVSHANLESNLRTITFIGIVAIGQALLLITGEFDLSVGSVAALGAVVGGLFMHVDHVPVPLAVVLAVLVGAGVGLINGMLVVKLRLPALIVTLGMLFIARGAAYVLSQGKQVYPLPHGIAKLSSQVLGLPVSVWIFVVLGLVAELVTRRSGFGRRLYATGGNEEASLLAGIRTDRIKLSAFVATGALAAFSGVLVMSQLHAGDPQIGTGWELSVVAAVVVGGVSLRGGVGTIAGALLGVLFLQVVSSGLVVAGVEATLQPVAVGVVMIAALALDQLRQRRYGT
jgi:ribose transport system permease protein